LIDLDSSHTLPQHQSDPELLRLEVLEPTSLSLCITLQDFVPRRIIMQLIFRCHICASTGFVVGCLGRIMFVMRILDDDALCGVSLNWVHGLRVGVDPGGYGRDA